MLCQAFSKKNRCGPAGILLQKILKLALKRRPGNNTVVSLFQFEDRRHQNFSHVAAAVRPEMTTLIRL